MNYKGPVNRRMPASFSLYSIHFGTIYIMPNPVFESVKGKLMGKNSCIQYSINHLFSGHYLEARTQRNEDLLHSEGLRKKQDDRSDLQ